MRPFGVGPRQGWTSVIVEREEGDGSAHFVDEMEGGPFRHWRHTHRFFADGDETVVNDRVEYRLPLGPIGDAVGPLARIGLEPMFRYRHRKTKELLE
jgi:ligand-binding SRPBCC domain-containing protein